jgi:L-threonylcarbamoyladenylate synthase
MSSPFQIRQAASAIRNQGVICYPTESVFGLGCDPLSYTAVDKILQLKQRPVEKGLILIAGCIEQLTPYVLLSDAQRTQILEQASATTWLVSKSAATPPWISGQHSKVAIRLSKHPLVQALCNQLDHAIVSTSANPSTQAAARTLLRVKQYFPGELDYYLNGALGDVGNATPIIDIESGAIIRA